MKKIRLFSAKATKDVEGAEAELYVNFYLVLSRKCIFNFVVNSPNLSCSGRHPIKLWKRFLILFEEETVKYMRRYERTAGYIANDNYINCLKSDLSAILDEFDLELYEQYDDTDSIKVKDIRQAIQQKINALESESEV